MKFFATATSVLAILLTVQLSEAFAGVSISIGEPGFYGRIDIGNYPPPRLIYTEPIIARRVNTWYPPIYLRVPPNHIQHWHRYCNSYNACGRPVYFVEDAWYRDVYAPSYREHRRFAGPPPPPPHHHGRPAYYEYQKYDKKPPKKIYPQEGYRPDGPPRGDGRWGR